MRLRTAAVTSTTEPPDAGAVVNDVHSQLNRTTVQRTVAIESVGMLQRVVRDVAQAGGRISMAGGRHAMGGQQFGTQTVLLDMTPLARVIDFDREQGLITVEAGIDWPRLVTHLLWANAGASSSWGIVQKQTGADRLTIGGALSANIHGRGLRLKPFVADIESFDLVDPTGALVTCSRSLNPRLFSLAVGGYGLFGAIARVTLRLTDRHKVERRVTIARVDDLPFLFEERIAQGYEFGDCQFAIDPSSEEFLQSGVFSCYRPVGEDRPIPADQRALTPTDWQRLLLLAHRDKSRAFAEYAHYYMGTDGQLYWSDTHQMSHYLDDYHPGLDQQLDARVKGSEMISELYVRRSDLPAFMTRVRQDARANDFNIIYGTIRIIEREEETLLAWAREPWACVVFNLHVDHTAAGLRKAQWDFRMLIDRAAEFGGSYYLTYHRWATGEQVERCHPRMREFLRAKHEHDPAGVFWSDWYEHHARLLDANVAATARQGEAS
jgi:FAD/FMN-containing dehydrogenase